MLWRMLAVACRYGRAGLLDALDMPIRSLALFNEAVGDLIEAENKTSPEQRMYDSRIEGGG
jgi:hypothetical protein